MANWLSIAPEHLNFSDEVTNGIKEKKAPWDSGIGYDEREIFDVSLKLPLPQRKGVRKVILNFDFC